MTGLYRALWLPMTICLALNACAGYRVPSMGFSSGPLQVKGKLKPASVQPINPRRPVYIRVEDYRDARDNAPSRQIGAIRNTHVSDLHSYKIVIDGDVAALVTAAMKGQLAAGGYHVVGAADRAAFVLSGKVERFRYDVYSQDHVDMQVQSSLRGADGRVLWAGTVKEQFQRFAGVMGDNRATIVHFIGKGLQNVTRKTLTAISGALARARPDLFLQAGAPVPGVAVQAAPPSKATAPGGKVPPAGRQGTLDIGTAPDGVKVYIGDVYYGSTPLKLHLAPGIYTVRLVAAGYQEVTQKVSVREGDTTRWETTMTK